MSKVLYKIKVKDRLPETNKPVTVEFKSGEVLRATVDENGYWWCVDMVSDLDEPDYWYSETPSLELAEVLDNIKTKNHLSENGQTRVYKLGEFEIKTLLNELLN